MYAQRALAVQGESAGLGAMANKLRFAVIISATILVAELVAGLLSNSLALLSDAGHVFVDIIALSLSWYGVRQAERPSSARMVSSVVRQLPGIPNRLA